LGFSNQTVTICTISPKKIKPTSAPKNPTFLTCIAFGDEGSKVWKIHTRLNVYLMFVFQPLEKKEARFSKGWKNRAKKVPNIGKLHSSCDATCPAEALAKEEALKGNPVASKHWKNSAVAWRSPKTRRSRLQGL